MNREEHANWIARRNEMMLSLVWPEVEKRMKRGKSPKDIAEEMSMEGYWGFTSNRMGSGDIQRLSELAILAGLNGVSIIR